MFTIKSIPTAFSVFAYEKATFSSLNPINRTQSWTNCIIGKPIRATIRAVVAVAIMFFSPFGAIYHLGASVTEACKGRSIYAWEHLKAAKTDLINTVNVFTPFIFAFSPTDLLPLLASASLIRVDFQHIERVHDHHFNRMTDDRKRQILEGKYQLNKWYQSVISSRETYVSDVMLIRGFSQPLVNERIRERVETGISYGDFWHSKILSERDKIDNFQKLRHIVHTYITQCEGK